MGNLIVIITLACFMSSAINTTYTFQNEDIDTVLINNSTRQAYTTARQNPDLAISEAYRVLSVSRAAGYKKGIADASLALGMAYFTKYNPGDSSSYYNFLALDLYEELGDITGQARAYYCLAYVYSVKGNLVESEHYSRLSLNSFEKAGDKRGMVNSLSALTYLFRQKNDFNGAIEMTNMAIEIARSINDTIPLADALNTLGNIYKDMLLFNEAIDSYFEALNLWELKRDTNGMAIAYGSIGLMYYYQEDYDMALTFNFRKVPVCERSGDHFELSKCLNNIAQIYAARNQPDSSIHYLKRSLDLNEKMNYPSGVAAASQIIASTFLIKDEIDSATMYIERAVAIAERLNDSELPSYLITLGQIQKRKKDFNSALKNARRAYSEAGKQNKAIVISSAAALLSDLYNETGNKALAYDYLKEYYSINDSISNNEFLKKVTRLEIENEYNRRQEEADFEHRQELLIRENRITQQNLYLKGLILLLVLLAVITFFYIHNTRLRVKYERIDLEQRLLRAQMNPHFIFNSLCAVQELILSGHPEKANVFLVKIASLMRNILENSREEFIPLEKEIETIRLYLDIQQLRFESEFVYNITFENDIDPENISVPPMLAQPCLENSVEHGLLPLKNGKGRIDISYNSFHNNLLRLEVTDNGAGRRITTKSTSKGMLKKSLSTTLIQERLAFFRKKLKIKEINYDITDLYDNTTPSGTRVTVVMPYRKIFN
ncbi:MAG: histidine kinase [Bacteroidetes bacterium]|jgi:tetratricopeptide (TPR) repeat protein|nr:histidine kinase [Bacteroidota bacterium]